MTDMETMANEAEVIICGYAVSRYAFGFRVINLHDLGSCSIFRGDGCLIETNMNDVELSVAREYFKRALKYMEDGNAEIL